QAKLNGKGPYRLIFDTGAPETLISTRIARDAGVEKNEATLEIGELKADHVPVKVGSHSAVRALGAEGMIGLSFYARFCLTINYQKLEMTFVPTSYQPPSPREISATIRAQREELAAKVVAPPGRWGLVVDKEERDADAGVCVKKVVPESAA